MQLHQSLTFQWVNFKIPETAVACDTLASTGYAEEVGHDLSASC